MKTVVIALTMVALLHVTPTVYGLPVSKADSIVRRASLDPTLFTQEPSANLYDPRAFVTSSPDTHDPARRGSFFKFLNRKSPDASQLSAAHMDEVKEQKDRLQKLKAELKKLQLVHLLQKAVDLNLTNARDYLTIAEGKRDGNPAAALKSAQKEIDGLEGQVQHWNLPARLTSW